MCLRVCDCRNPYTYVGIGAGFAVAAAIVYIPGLSDRVVGAFGPPWPALLVPVGAGVVLFAYEFARRFLRKRGFFGGFPGRNADGADETGTSLLSLLQSTSTAAKQQ